MNVVHLFAILCTGVLGDVAISNDELHVSDNVVDIENIKVKVKPSFEDNPKYIKTHVVNETETHNLKGGDLSETTIQPPESDLSNVISDESGNTESESEPSQEKETETPQPLILTPYIDAGELEEARAASEVNSTLFLGVKSYSGYLTVNKKYNSNMFFWYFPAEGGPAEDTPWLVWLQGGPGASSMIALFDELGPFTFNTLGQMEKNPYSWTLNQSVVFIDNPVGTGFSFTDHVDGLARNIHMYSRDLHAAVAQLVRVFPELSAAPLYVAGESYGGKYVPGLAWEIHRRRNETHINLQGLIIGNGYMDPQMVKDPTRAAVYVGMLSAEQVDLMRPFLRSLDSLIKANKTLEAQKTWSGIVSMMLHLTSQRQLYNFLYDDSFYVSMRSQYPAFLSGAPVRAALHVGDRSFSLVNMTVHAYMCEDFLVSSRSLVEELLEHYRVLSYCGNLDLMIPCVVSSEQYRTWRWPGAPAFRAAVRFPYKLQGKLVGYHKTGGNFTEVVVRGAGHMVPHDAPAAALDLVSRWVRARPLPASPTIATFVHFLRKSSQPVFDD